MRAAILCLAAIASCACAAPEGTGADGWTFISPAGEWNGRKLDKEETAAAFAVSVTNAGEVASVEIDATALGVFELYVNGRLVSTSEDGNRSDFLRPGATDPHRRRAFLRYVVDEHWSKSPGSENRIAAFVARSWFSDTLAGRIDVKPAFAAKVRLRHADGSEGSIRTDASWRASFRTPFLRAGIYYGEVRDGRIFADAYACAGDAAAEVNESFTGVVSPAQGPGVSLRRDLALAPVKVYAYSGAEGVGEGMFGRVANVRKFAPGERIRLDVGERLVLDFAQNAAAIPEIRARAVEGTVLTFRGGEMLNEANGEKSRGNDAPAGSVYRENYREITSEGAMVKYIFRGEGVETYLPTFTFMGYRYAEIDATAPVEIESVVSIPVTSIARSMERGSITTGDGDVNRLVSNVRWGQYSNYLSIPTDCPQRDERMGWAADTQVFAAAAFRNADVRAFLAKWMTDMRDAQETDSLGRFPSAAPMQRWGGCEFGRLGWGDAGVIVPWTCWRMTGDTRILAENWDAMCRFLDFQQKTKCTWQYADLKYQYADWLSFENYESRHCRGWDGDKPTDAVRFYWDYLAACYWHWNAKRMSEMSRALGKPDDAVRFAGMAEESRRHLKERFFGADGRLPEDLRTMQTPQLFALHLGLYDDASVRGEAAALLVKNIESHGNRLQTGFLGTSIIMDTLTYDVGRPDLAYTLLLQHEKPSWLYSVDQGATTMWERWDSYTKESGFGPVMMNSFNHYAYGAVLDWMYGTAAGINPGPKGGFGGEFVLAPIPDPRLKSVSASFKTKNGVIKSAWKYDGGRCEWRFSVPPGSVAHVKFGVTEGDFAAGEHVLSFDESASRRDAARRRAEEIVSKMSPREMLAELMMDAPGVPRLGVPPYHWWGEGLHGVARSGLATVFPQSMASAASFDAALMQEIGDAVSTEARAKHNLYRAKGQRGIHRTLTLWCPNVNMFRDPRWGRGQETFGEDPFLAGSMGKAYVLGLQGDDRRYLKTAACAKHFAVHSGPEALRHGFNAKVSQRDLAEYYLPAFRALVQDGGVESVMGAYSALNGTPCCASKWLLTDLLRGEWGFRGHVVSDVGAIADIATGHKAVAGLAEASKAAMAAGIDLCSEDTYKSLEPFVASGEMGGEALSVPLTRLYTTRAMLGQFDPPGSTPWDGLGADDVANERHRALALRMAEESIVLVHNNGALPLDVSKMKCVGVAGIRARDEMALLGNYCGYTDSPKTVLSGVVKVAGPGVRVMNDFEMEESDAIIVCLGITADDEGEEGSCANGASGDRVRYALPESQLSALRRYREKHSGSRIVTVVFGCSPFDLAEVEALSDAVLVAWYPGERGGEAVANVIFGKVSPSGRLPITYPRAYEDLPDFADYTLSGRTYIYAEKKPLHPFGYGLSYTTFAYSEPMIRRLPGAVKVSVLVKNTGARPGDEVVQAYVRAPAGAGDRRLHHLEGFARVSLAPGESKCVEIMLPERAFHVFGEDGRPFLPDSPSAVFLGGGQPGFAETVSVAVDPQHRRRLIREHVNCAPLK